MPRVLIVEDNPDNQEIYLVYLTYLGYEVRVVRSAEDGLAAVAETRPDLILMDISLPGMSGLEAVQILKSDPDTSSIKVVAVTAHLGSWVKEQCEKAGCDGFLIKPVAPAIIGQTVRHFVGIPT